MSGDTPQRVTVPGPSDPTESLQAIISDRLSFYTRITREYGDVVEVRFPDGRGFYHLGHPDHVRHVLVENNGNYQKGVVYRALGQFMGEGLFFSEGEFWRQQRHKIEPAFHPKRLESHGPMMGQYVLRMFEDWEDGQVRDLFADMLQVTLEISAKALFGVDLHESSHQIESSLQAVADYFWNAHLSEQSLEPGSHAGPPMGVVRAMWDLDEAVTDVINSRRESPGEDVVSALLHGIDGEEGEQGTSGMDPQQVRDEVVTLLFAGHETTGELLAFTFGQLARYPDVADRVREEVDSVVGNRPPTFADRGALEYTERVLRETLRLYPPFHSFARESIEGDTIGGYDIPAGETIGLPQWVIHRDPRFYNDPLVFRPDRWTDEFRKQLHPFAFFPFGGGPRRCVGERFAMIEAKLIIAAVVQRYSLETVPETDFDVVAGTTLRPRNGMQLRVTKR